MVVVGRGGSRVFVQGSKEKKILELWTLKKTIFFLGLGHR